MLCCRSTKEMKHTLAIVSIILLRNYLFCAKMLYALVNNYFKFSLPRTSIFAVRLLWYGLPV